ALHLEQLLILTYQRVLRLRQDAHQRLLIERVQRSEHRQTTDELRNHAELDQVVAGYLRQHLAEAALGLIRALEAHRVLRQPPGNDLVQPDERAAADEQDVRRVDLDVLLLGMLASALRRDVADRPFEHLQQRLLN